MTNSRQGNDRRRFPRKDNGERRKVKNPSSKQGFSMDLISWLILSPAIVLVLMFICIVVKFSN